MWLLNKILDLILGDVNKMLDEFEEAFPGKCPICAYHRYGITEGHEKPGIKPAAHSCPEA